MFGENTPCCKTIDEVRGGGGRSLSTSKKHPPWHLRQRIKGSVVVEECIGRAMVRSDTPFCNTLDKEEEEENKEYWHASPT
jgi:hypothetical protein